MLSGTQSGGSLLPFLCESLGQFHGFTPRLIPFFNRYGCGGLGLFGFKGSMGCLTTSCMEMLQGCF